MHPRIRYSLAAAAFVLSACAGEQLAPDRVTTPDGITQIQPGPSMLVVLPAECATEARAQGAIDSLLPQLFGPGGGRRGKAQGYSNAIEKSRRDGDTAVAQDNVDSLVNFTLSTYYAKNLIGGQSTATQDRVVKFIYLLYCSNNISPIPDLSGIFSAGNTVLIRNSTPTTVVNDPLDSAAVQVEHGEVPSTIFGTFVSVYKTTNPLPTSLDWYGIDGYKQGAFEFVANPAVTFTSPVLTGVCISYDADIVSPTDLRLAHGVETGYVSVVPGNSVVTTSGGTIEIGAYSDPGPLGLACDPLPAPPVAAKSVFGRALQQLARVFVPGPLFAAVGGGGTGSQVVKFSPFAAVDVKLAMAGSGPASPQYIAVGDSQTTAPVSVTVKTRKGLTPISGVSVSFAPGTAFSPASAATGADGSAGSSWTLKAGTNSATATSGAAPFVFVPAVASFSVNAIQLLALSVTTSALPGGQQSVAYGPDTLAATGGTGSYTWGLAPSSALPGGLSLSTAGVLSGTPTVSGAFSFTVRVTSGSLTADKALSINILPAPVVIATASPLPAATVGVAYAQSFLAEGGTGSYSWLVSSGAPPAGLALSAAGALTGVPSAPGSSTFVVQATSGPVSASKSFTLTASYPTALALAFQSAPSKSACYAVNAALAPAVSVRVTDQAGRAVAGVTVNMTAIINNGSWVAVSQPTAVTGVEGVAVFNTLSINKTGGYTLRAATLAPWPAVSVQSGKFNISPACS